MIVSGITGFDPNQTLSSLEVNVEVALRIAGVLVGLSGSAVFGLVLFNGDRSGAWGTFTVICALLTCLIFAFYGIAGKRIFRRFFPSAGRNLGE